MKIVVVGIGTNVGKTIVSSILVQNLKAAYWKPVQAGDLEDSDSNKINRLTSYGNLIILEKWRLKIAASPHKSAHLENINIDKSDFKLPEVTNNLVIETAGGLMVPVNQDGLLYIDIVENWNLPVVLVSRNYLGSINHTLLSINLLKQRNISILAVIYNGIEDVYSESIVKKIHPELTYVNISELKELTPEYIALEASKLDFNILQTNV
jgi:dethiobiotin synthetase